MAMLSKVVIHDVKRVCNQPINAAFAEPCYRPL